jgi:hypothetical protein
MDQIKSTPELELYFRSNDPNNKSRTTTFEYLWVVFAPGCLVYSAPVMKQPQVFIFQNWFLNKDSINLTCWSYDWNGEPFDRVAYEFRVERFTGTEAINSLEHYPLEYHRDKDGNLDNEALKKSVIDRGRRFHEICVKAKGSHMFDYEGPALRPKAHHKAGSRQDCMYLIQPFKIVDGVGSD